MTISADRVQQILCNQCGKSVDTSAADPFTAVSCPGCNARLSVPARLGSLLLLKPIGTGGMGVVYRALDTTLRRPVAVKVLKQADKEHEEQVKAILAEARALAALNHPNVVHVFSIGYERNQPFIVMELVDGGRLDKLIKDHGAVPELTVLQIAIDVAEGLKAARGVGLTHGDIKPANILLNQQGTAKLVDFGVARHDEDEKDHGFLGTPYFVAPEIALGKRLDLRCDIFSLGATLFNALTGQRPFKGENLKEIIRARLKIPAPNIRTINPALHPPTAAVVAHMMEIDPDRRPQNYDDLLAELRAAYAATAAGPVDTALLELGEALSGSPAARVEVAAARSHAAAKSSQRSATASKSLSRQGRTLGRPKSKSKVPLFVGLGLAGVALVVGVLVALFAGGPGSTGTSTTSTRTDQPAVIEPIVSGVSESAGSFRDEFKGSALHQSWKSTGNLTPEFRKGEKLRLSSSGAGSECAITREVGTGGFDLEVKFNPIKWNPDIESQVALTFRDDDDNSFEVRIEKVRSNKPRIVLINEVKGQKRLERSEPLTSVPQELLLSVQYDAAASSYKVSYGLDGAAASTPHPASPVTTGYAPSKKRTVTVAVRGIQGDSSFHAALDHFYLKR